MNTTYTITNNTQFNSIEIAFNGKPSAEVREALKALRFRWHGQKKVWYGYAAEAEARAAIESTGAQQIPEAPKAPTVKKPTAQDHIRIYWNGIKIDGGKLIKCGYSLDNNLDNSESVSIYAHGYGSQLPRDLFEVRNDTDLYTDYFDNDSAHLTPEHPLYKYFRYAAEKAQARMDRTYCEKLRETLNSGRREPWPGHYDNLRADLARREKFLEEFEKKEDPGQPTAEDLAEIDRQRQEAENARKAAEHEKQLRERENYLNIRNNGRHLIETESAAHPIEDGAPVVLIHWSEHPAFESWADDELTLSLAAAEIILRNLDAEQHTNRETVEGWPGYYFKTKFTISGKDANGEDFSYSGRYDLGDGEGGLIQHIRNFGEWYRTHDDFGHEIQNPEETNDTILFADYLATFAA